MPLGKLDQFSAVALAVKRTSRIHSHQASQKKIAASNISFFKQVSFISMYIYKSYISPPHLSESWCFFGIIYSILPLSLTKHVRFISKAHLWSQGLNLCGTPGGDFPPSAAAGNKHYFNPWLTGEWWISTLNFARKYLKKCHGTKKSRIYISGVVDCFLCQCVLHKKPDAYLPFASSKFKETNINSIKD